MPTDAELARRACDGDDDAFATLVRRHRPMLLRVARAALGARPADAEDVVQEALAGAHAALRGGAQPAAVRPWLATIVRRRVVDHLRRARAEVVALDDAVAGPDDAAEAALLRARVTEVLAAVEHLPDAQRQALLLRELHGLSHEEVAAALDVTPAAAKALGVRARAGVKRFEHARVRPCRSVRSEIADAVARGARGSAPVAAHVAQCRRCAAFERRLRGRGAHAWLPVGLVLAWARVVRRVGPDAPALAGSAGDGGLAAKLATGACCAFAAIGGGAAIAPVAVAPTLAQVAEARADDRSERRACERERERAARDARAAEREAIERATPPPVPPPAAVVTPTATPVPPPAAVASPVPPPPAELAEPIVAGGAG